MKDYQKRFIDFAIQQQALRFGEYQLKSGRTSPYFFNIGDFNSGVALSELGHYYAAAIDSENLEFDLLFGPAYKGIPLACAVAISLARDFGRDVPYCFNRKELKEHGEGGLFVGAPLQGRMLIIDDVITAGTTFREMAHLLADYPVEISGVVTALDRAERGQSEKTAIQELSDEFSLSFYNVIKLDHIVEYLAEQPNMNSELERLKNYRAEYGVAQS